VLRVTLDTNEYVSALNGGRASRFLYMALEGDIEIAISEPIIAETIRVLREKFDWPPYDLLDARQRLERIAKMFSPKTKLAIVADEPDNRILECAAESGSDYIVTEDRALLRVRYLGVAKLITATQFFDVLLARGR
jgi:putative PIN family toxin of toxin-antitoxin system